MATYEVTDFKGGMDLRKMYATAPAGSLRLLHNAVITAGAEIEKRLAFVLWNTAPTGTLGLLARDGLTYTIQAGPSSITVPPNASTLGIIQIPYSGRAYDYVADWDLFDGEFYIVMHNPADNKNYHYYKQLAVADVAATSHFVRTYRDKMYGLDGRLLRFSAIGDPTKWTAPVAPPNDGSGYIDLSAQDADSTDLIGMEAYYDQMAIFSSLSTQLWALDPDPTKNKFNQLLRQTGLIAPHGVTQFGSGDVMYLSPYGIRSLRVQNISLTAGTTDLGSPIDPPLRELIRIHPTLWFRFSRAHIQPRTGRLWLVLPDRLYVLSTFQEPAITAWSVFDDAVLPNITDSCIADPYMMIRGADNKIYRYGGDALNTYDAGLAEAIMPALSLDNPADMKTIQSFDIACEGEWRVYASFDINQPNAEELVATVVDSTFNVGQMMMPTWATHISLRFRTNAVSAAKIGKVLIHYEKGKED